MMEQEEYDAVNGIYPREDGDQIVIGPECFADKDGKVLSWRGQSYVPVEDPLDSLRPDLAVWTCKIGELPHQDLPKGIGADLQMREVVEAGYFALTGKRADFVFSGWGGRLTEPERAVYEDRMPQGPFA